VTLALLDLEPDASITSADRLATTTRADGYSFTLPYTVSPGSTAANYTVDVTQLVRDALRRGRLRVGLKLSASGGSPEFGLQFGAAGTTRLELVTAPRYGVVSDVYDANGRQLASRQGVVDMRDFPAGEFFVRVYDPLMDGASSTYQRAGDVNFQVAVEAPKLGEFDPPSDRDELFGGDGNDSLLGGNAVDRIFGQIGVDTFTAKVFEVQDKDVGGAETIVAPPAGEDQNLGNGTPSQDVPVTLANAFLSLEVGRALGLTVTPGGGSERLLRPLRATDLTQLVELYDFLATSYTGLEYATNLEFLTVNSVDGAIETGVRAARAAHGELGLRNLRYLAAVNGGDLFAQTSQVTGGLKAGTQFLTGLQHLRYLNLDGASTTQTTNPWADISLLTNLRWLSAENLDNTINNFLLLASPSGTLPHLRYLALNNSEYLVPNVDLTAVAGWGNLVEVELQSPNVKSVDPLTGHVTVDNQVLYANPVAYTEYATFDTGWTGNAHPNAFQGDYRIIPSEAGYTPVEYTLTGLVPGEQYDLWVTWTANERNTTRANYRVFDSSTGGVFTLLGEANLSQTVAPVGDTYGGRPWQKAFRITVPAGVTSLSAFVSNFQNFGNTVADAVRLTRAVLPNLRVLDARTAQLGDSFYEYNQGELQAKLGAGLLATPNADPQFTGASVAIGTQTIRSGVETRLRLSGSDPDGTAVSFAAFSGAPGLSVSVAGTELVMTPAAGFTGTVPVTVRLSDELRTVEQTFDVTVVGQQTMEYMTYPFGNLNDQREPAVARAADGRSVVVWEGDQSGVSNIYGQLYDRAGIKVGGVFLISGSGGSPSASWQTSPAVDMDDAGNFVVTWESDGYLGASVVFARRYNAAGVAQGNAFTVAFPSYFSFVFPYQYSEHFAPSVAVDADGDFVVAWTQGIYLGAINTGTWDVLALRFSAAGVAQGATFLVNQYTTGEQSYPVVASDAAGNFVIAYNSFGVNGNGFEIYSRRFNAVGTALANEERVNTTLAGGQSAPTLAMNAAGQYVVGWVDTDGPNGYEVRAQRYTPTGTKFGGELSVNTYTTNSQTLPSAGIDTQGNFAFVWQSWGQDGSLWGVYGRRYDWAGDLVSGEFQVSGSTGDYQYTPALAMGPDGDMHVTWASFTDPFANTGGILNRTYTNPATPSGTAEARVNTYTTNAQTYPKVAASANGTSVAVWQSFGQDGSSYGIYAQRYSAAGFKVGTEFRVNTLTANVQQNPAVAMAADGRFVVVWESDHAAAGNSDVYYRRYNADGTPADATEVRANTVTANTQTTPAVAMDSDGDFVVVWQSDLQDGSLTGVYARRFSAAGLALIGYNPDGTAQSANEFRVNNTTANAQGEPVIGMDAAGNFLIVWRSDFQDGGTGGFGSGGIFARRYNTAGQPQGPQADTLVNTTINGNQRSPTVTMNAGGQAVVAWLDASSGFYDIRAQRYTAAGATPIGGELLLNTSRTVYNQPERAPALAIDRDGNFTAAWATYEPSGVFFPTSDLTVRRFDRLGVAAGPEVRLNTTTAQYQSFPALAAAPNGDVIAVWADSALDGSADGVFLRRLTNSAVLTGQKREFLTNQPVEGVTIFLDTDGDGLLDAGEMYTVTDVAGRYTLRGVPGGTQQRLTEFVPAAWRPTSGNPFQIVTVLDGEYKTGIDFQNARVIDLGPDQTINEGTQRTFTGPSAGTGNVWRVNGVIQTGQTGNTFTFTVPDDQLYTVSLTTTFGGQPYTDAVNLYGQDVRPTVSFATETATLFEGTWTITPNYTVAAVDTIDRQWTLARNGVTLQTGTSVNPTYTLPDDGVYTLTLRVRDEDQPAVWAEDTITLTAVNKAPYNLVVQVAPTGTVGEGTPVTLNGTFVDDGTADTHTFSWTVTGPGGQNYAGTSASIGFTPQDDGVYAVAYRVTDDDSGATTLNTTLTVANVAPSGVTVTGPATTDEEVPTTYTPGYTAAPVDTLTFTWTVQDAQNAVIHSQSSPTLATLTYAFQYSGRYTVTVTVTDDDGSAVSSAAFPVTVRNVRPRSVAAGGGGITPEGTPITLTGTYRDPGLPDESFTLAWVVTNATGSVVATAAGASYPFAPPDNGSYTATFVVTNIRTGLSASASTAVTATNANPTATLTGPAVVGVDQSFTLALTGATDAGSTDVLFGLRFAFDFNNDGVYEVGNGTYAGSSASFTASAQFSSAGVYTARGRVLDKDGGFTDYTLQVSVAPGVVSAVVNGGQTDLVQRSRVTTLTVTFDSVVTIDAAAFTLRRTGGYEGTAGDNATVVAGFTTQVVAGRTVATLTFAGASVESGSLADGTWTLTVDRTKVRSAVGNVQMAADFVQGGITRLYGDFNGDGSVTLEDYEQFGAGFGLSDGDPGWAAFRSFDYNGDGTINLEDYEQFGNRFGRSL
jgi:hypothetical protein